MIDIRNFSNVCTDDATFRAMVQAVHDALEAVGMVQATDAGQINPATVVRPAVSTEAGLEYWHLPGNPAQLKGANGEPYISVNYGIHSNAAIGRVRFRVGYGSVFSPALATAQGLGGPPMSLTSGQLFSMYTQCDASGIRMAWASLEQSQGGVFAVEKPKDSAGVVTEEPIITHMVLSQASTSQIQLLEKNVLAGSVRDMAQAGVANLGTPVGSTNGATDLALEPMALTYRGKWLFGAELFGAFGDLNGAGLFDFDWLGYEQFRAIPTFGMFSGGSTTVCLPWE